VREADVAQLVGAAEHEPTAGLHQREHALVTGMEEERRFVDDQELIEREAAGMALGGTGTLIR
jgi:hypothetical protein